MTVPKAEDITEDQDTTKVESIPIYKLNNAQKKDAEKLLDKEHKPCARDKENLKIDAATNTEVALDSYNNINTNEVTLLPESRTEPARFSLLWKQVIAASPSTLLAFVSGLTMGYSAILIPQLMSGDQKISVNLNAMSWIASMAGLPVAPGCLISGWMMEKFGRRTSQGIICVVLLLGWILIASATNLPLLMAGRFFTGICIGLSSPLDSIYIGETMEPRFRGFFLAGLSLAKALGILTIHTLGTFLTWQWAAYICCLFPIQAIGILFIIPESPTWLIARGRVEKGVKAYVLLRGYSDKANAELRGILEKQNKVDSEPAMNCLEMLKMLMSRKLLKPFFIMALFFIVSDLSGPNIVWFFLMPIIQAFNPSIDYDYAYRMLNIGIVIMSAIACVVSQFFGRRHVTLFSGVFTALSLIGLFVLFLLREGMYSYIDTSWLFLLCLMMYICANHIGLVPLPWVMCGEIFPARVRALGSSLSVATSFTGFYILIKNFSEITGHLGYYIFLIYGVVTLAGTIVLYCILPETKGKSLQEIEEEFQ